MKHAKNKLTLAGFIISLGCLLIIGCSSVEPYEYHDDAETMSGPGLITGEEGEKTIFRIPAESEKQAEEAQAGDTIKEAPESERIFQP